MNKKSEKWKIILSVIVAILLVSATVISIILYHNKIFNENVLCLTIMLCVVLFLITGYIFFFKITKK